MDGVKKVYFIGIGGSSMSSLAQILKLRGCDVQGSDMQVSHDSEQLVEAGIPVHIGHSAANVQAFAPDAVIKTDAIMPDNPELVYAQQHGIPVYRRCELLGSILDGYERTVGVAGTHGKNHHHFYDNLRISVRRQGRVRHCGRAYEAHGLVLYPRRAGRAVHL